MGQRNWAEEEAFVFAHSLVPIRLSKLADRVTPLVRGRDFRDIRAMQAVEKMGLVTVDDYRAGAVAHRVFRVRGPLAAIAEGV